MTWVKLDKRVVKVVGKAASSLWINKVEIDKMSSGYAEAGMKILQRPIKQMDIIVKFEDKM